MTTSRLGLLGLHVPGDTLLHRAPAGAKLLALTVLGLTLVILRGPVPALVGLALVGVGALVARLPFRTTLGALRPVLLTTALLVAYQVWQRGASAAVEVGGELLALVLGGALVTATTPADRLVDVLVRLARPLRHVGVDPEHLALAVALMLRAVPALGVVAEETRDAARARGLERSARARTVPLAVRAVARARATGDALAARGLGDPAA